MESLQTKNNKLIYEKWVIFILLSLRKETRISYKKISQISQIPTSTLSIKLKELIKQKLVEKFVYGSVSKPHNVDYKITGLGIECINNLFSIKK